MTTYLEIDALRRLRDHELLGLRKLFFWALTCPVTNPADIPAIRATLRAIEDELARRTYRPAPAP